jgi:hypothetical protein
MPATYEKIATTTLGSNSSTITFSGISGSYTDLRLVLVAKFNAAGREVRMTFNSDTGTNYSRTFIQGEGTTATSFRSSNRANLDIISNGGSDTQFSLTTVDVFSYAGSTNKTCLYSGALDANGSGYVNACVGLWRSTSAITSITLTTSSDLLVTGTTATLYGILKA